MNSSNFNKLSRKITLTKSHAKSEEKNKSPNLQHNGS